MISDQLSNQIKRFMDMDEHQINLLLSAIAQFRSADKYLVELICDYMNLVWDDELSGYQKMVDAHAEICSFEHHVKAISLASILHNKTEICHPDLLKVTLQTNSHIKLHVLLDVLNQKLEPAT